MEILKVENLLKNIEIVEPTVTVKSAMKQNTIKELESLADSLL